MRKKTIHNKNCQESSGKTEIKKTFPFNFRILECFIARIINIPFKLLNILCKCFIYLKVLSLSRVKTFFGGRGGGLYDFYVPLRVNRKIT